MKATYDAIAMICDHRSDKKIIDVHQNEEVATPHAASPLNSSQRSLASSPSSATKVSTVTPQINTKRKAAPPSAQKLSSSFGPLWTQRRTRHAVIAPNESILASVPTVVPKPASTRNLLIEAIKPCLLFQGLPPQALEVIVDAMTPLEVSPGTMIIAQGDSKSCHEFFVIETGSCDVLIRADPSPGQNPALVPSLPLKVATYSAGQAFGELALLYAAPRAASVRSTSRCHLWVLQRSALFAIKKNFTERQNVERHALLEKVPSLKHLSPHHRALLVDALTQVEFLPGQSVFEKGAPGTDFFLIKEGAAVVLGNGQTLLAELTAGQYFGERALMGAELRAADVNAKTRLVCYRLSRKQFEDLLGTVEEVWRYEALRRVPLLYNLTERSQWRLAHALRQEVMPKGHVVFNLGDNGDNFYIIQEGSFTCMGQGGKELARIGEGSCFGELALLRQDKRAATVVALTDAKVLVLSRDEFNKTLGTLVQLKHVWCFENLRKVQLFQSLPVETIGKLAQAMIPINLAAGENVIIKGEVGDAMYIVESGRCGSFPNFAPTNKKEKPPSQDSPQLIYEIGGYFGEVALIRDEPRAVTICTLTQTTLYVLDKDHFKSLLGPLRNHMEKAAEAYYSIGPKKGLYQSNQRVDLSRLEVVGRLGKGGFGQVLLVKNPLPPLQQPPAQKPGGLAVDYELCALKVVKKQFVVEQKVVEHMRREREALCEAAGGNCPWIVKFMGTAQDSTNLYILMQAAMGGDLWNYLRKRSQVLDEEHARFYAASVILGLQYLHDRGLVYRDLKPENLLLDSNGYLLIADLGFCKKVPVGSKTFTICGTPEYISPEVIQASGHDQSSDLWCLGVLIYEMVVGTTPFYHQDRQMMFQKICDRDLRVPRTMSQNLRDLLDKLLQPNPTMRIGGGRGGCHDVLSHEWFKGFDWNAFVMRKMEAPYIPPPSKSMDQSSHKSGEDPEKWKFGQAIVRQEDKGVFGDF